MRLRFLLLSILLVGVGGFVHFYHGVTTPLARPFKDFPTQIGEWTMAQSWDFDDSTLTVLRPSDYMARRYVDGRGQAVTLYLSYHDGGPDAGPIHSPRHCLPGSGWLLKSEQPMRYDLDGDALGAVRAIYARGEGQEAFLYWFEVCGRPVTNEFAIKAGEILGSLTQRRRDSAFIRLSMSVREGEKADFAVLDRFVEAFYPTIKQFLPAK